MEAFWAHNLFDQEKYLVRGHTKRENMELDYHPMGENKALKLANSKWVSHHAMS